MGPNEIQDWITAGKIAAEAMSLAEKLVKENAKLIGIANNIHNFIEKSNAKTAFPVNLSLNNIAAHYSPQPNDETVLKSGDILKVDIGVSFNGAVGDHAQTFEVTTNKNQKLIEASRTARDNAIREIKEGIELRKIGSIIEQTMESYGFKPIKNLSGHGLARYTIHTTPTIPNYDNDDKTKLKAGQIIAIEPFATTGSGYIKEGKMSTIYRLNSTQSPRDANARKILEFIKSEFKTLPFSKLQIFRKFPNPTTNLALNMLEKQGIIYQYAQLLEEEPNAIIAQAEHTILVEKEGCRILTKI